MPARKFRIGDKVQSSFRSRWHGIVVEELWVQSFEGKGKKLPLCLVVCLLTADGRPQRKPHVTRLSERWLDPSDKLMTLPANISDLMPKEI
jgi:hypothetical protein